MKRDWVFAVAGPLAWFAAHVASWMLVPGAHDHGALAGLYAVDLAAVIIAVIAAVLALGRVRALRGVPDRQPGLHRDRFVAGSALALAVLSVLLVVGLTLPVLLLVPGAEP
jgi:hypothetical protein